MTRLLPLLLVLSACDGKDNTPPSPRDRYPVADKVKDGEPVIDLMPAAMGKKGKIEGLGGIICLRMDQLAMNRAALKQIGGRALAGLMVDATPRQAEIYGKTGKFPSETKGEKQDQRKDMFERMMDVADIQAATWCFDEAVDECIASEGRGKVCFTMAMKTCSKYDTKNRDSHCDRLD